MGDSHPASKQSFSSGTWISVLGVLVILYILSPAPVAKALELVSGKSAPSKPVTNAFHVIYYPLGLAIMEFQTVEQFYYWEFEFCHVRLLSVVPVIIQSLK